ncbi:hypothetical protein [Kitasatospora sp. NPDC090091]|uniref:hypothetical protein n=1 Tax=Kitasatospora sp. NPDC090091 TaxID=3364081 RepID=UPI00381E1F07
MQAVEVECPHGGVVVVPFVFGGGEVQVEVRAGEVGLVPLGRASEADEYLLADVEEKPIAAGAALGQVMTMPRASSSPGWGTARMTALWWPSWSVLGLVKWCPSVSGVGWQAHRTHGGRDGTRPPEKTSKG